MTRDALIEAMAKASYDTYQGLAAHQRPWEAESEARKDYYRRHGHALADAVVAFVAEWMEGVSDIAVVDEFVQLMAEAWREEMGA